MKLFPAVVALYKKWLINSGLIGRVFGRHVNLLIRFMCLGCLRTLNSLAAVFYDSRKATNVKLFY